MTADPRPIAHPESVHEPLDAFARGEWQESLNTLYALAALLAAVGLILPSLIYLVMGGEYLTAHRYIQLSAAALLAGLGLWSKNRVVLVGTQPLPAMALLVIFNATLFLTLITEPEPNTVWPLSFLVIGTALLYPRYRWMGLTLLLQVSGIAWAMSQSDLPIHAWGSAVLQFSAALIMCTLIFAYQRRGLRRLMANRAKSLFTQQQLSQQMQEQSTLQEQAHINRQLAALSRLGGGLLHDFNNILMPIMGNASLLRDSDLSSAQQQRISAILQAAERAAALSRQMSVLAGQHGGRDERIDLTRAVDELVKAIWRTLPAGASVTLQESPEPIWLDANRSKLQRVLAGLLISLVERHQALPAKAESAADPASVNKSSSSLQLKLSTTDSPAEAQLHITVSTPTGNAEVDSTDRLAADLSYAQRALQALGGRLEFIMPQSGKWQGLDSLTSDLTSESTESPAPTSTHISDYLIVLPLPQENSATDTAIPADEPIPIQTTSATGKLVLVVDDEANVREVTGSMLERDGFRVQTATTGEDAIAACKTEVPALILMDMRMPGMGGRDAINAIQQFLPEVPIIVCTGYDNQSTDWIERQSNLQMLAKPFTANTLLARVRLTLGLTLQPH